MSRKKNKWLRRWRESFAISVLKLLSTLSLRSAQRLGRGVGWWLYRFDNTNRRIARKNLEHAYPDMPVAEREALLKQFLTQLGMTVMEGGAVWLWKVERLRALIIDIDGLEVFEAAQAEHRGVVFVGPHMGNWEILGAWVTGVAPVTGLYKPPKMPAMDKLVRDARERLPAEMAAADQSGVRTMLGALKKDRVLFALSDHEPTQGGGVFAPFFNVSAYTPTFVPKLVERTKSPVVIAYAERLPNAAGFRIRIRPGPRWPEDWTDVSTATALNDGLEALIRENPSQFLWNYKRFRSRPEGEGPFYQRKKKR